MTTDRSATGAAARPPEAGLRENVIETARLAGPVIVARSGGLILIAVDTAMTGRAGADELAYLAIGLAPQVVLFVVCIGLLAGTAVLSAQADGAGARHDCGAIWRLAMLHALVLGMIAGLFCLGGERFLLATGQEPALARGGGEVMAMFAWGMPGIMLGISTSFFLEGIRRPKAGMVVMLSANVVNAALNWIFIFGNLGAPAMGAEGAALATSASRCGIAAALIAYVFIMPGGAVYGIRGPIARARELARKLRRIGYPLGLAYGLETAALMTLVLMAGYLGSSALAAFQIAHNLISLVFMTALGFATATAVRVGHAVGRRHRPAMAIAGWTGITMAALTMALFSVPFLALPEVLAAAYTDDPELALAAAAIIWVVGLLLVFDGVQGVTMGALRGAGDVWIPACLHLFSFWAVAIPTGALLAFHWGWGARGLMIGLLVGMAVASIILSLRFRVISKRDIRRL